MAPTPLLVAEAGAALVGGRLTDAAIRQGGGAWPRRPPGRSATCAATPIIAGTWSACWSSARVRGLPSSVPSECAKTSADREQEIHVQTTINGEETEFLCEPRQSLLEVLRDELRLTGTKEGCNNGNCGACNVLLDGRLVNRAWCWASRSRAARSPRSKASPGREGLHPLQQKFLETRRCSAASARPASWSPPRRCSTSNPNPTEHAGPALAGRQPVPLHRL